MMNAPARLERPTVLVVDDDVALGGLIKDYLIEEQFEAMHVQDSMVALDLLKERPKIDLLLTDIALTQGTPNGVSLALMARRRVPNLTVLFMTGRPDLLDAVCELPGKALIKPVDLTELTQEIRRQLAA
jgi:two-component system, OmpR family, response regulator